MGTDVAVARSTVAEKLYRLRIRAALRSVDVAHMLGTTPETVSRWNRSRADPRPNEEKLLADLAYTVERLRSSTRTQVRRMHGYIRGTSISVAFVPPI